MRGLLARIPDQAFLALSYFLIGTLLLATLFSSVYFIAQNADTRAVIAALDNDASNAIDVAERSRWYNDNGFAGYGNLYFRLAHTLSATMSPFTAPGELSAGDGRTRTIHFALMLVSLLSLLALSGFLSWIAAEADRFRWLTLTFIFFFVFLQNDTYRIFILRAHPDHLLALIVAVASYLTVRSWREPQRYGTWCAWAWGVAVATKMSVILFLPFVALTMTPGLSRENLKQLGNYVLHGAAVYFLVGFPQNFNIPRTMRFLTHQSQFSAPPDLGSVIEWFMLLGQQALLPMTIVIILALQVRRFQWSWRTAVLLVGPFSLLLPQKIIPSHDHYTIPFVASQIAILMASFSLPQPKPSPSPKLLSALLLVAFATISWGQSSIISGWNQSLQFQLKCRPEAREAHSKFTGLISPSRRAFATTYFPTSNKMANVRSFWQPTPNYFVESGFAIFALNSDFISRYFLPQDEAYLRAGNKDFDQTQALYQPFRNLPERVQSETLGEWERVYSDSCGFVIYTKTGVNHGH